MHKNAVLNGGLDVPLTDKRRELMLFAIDGDSELAGTMYILHHYKHCDDILLWLIRHKYVGKNLRDLLIKKFHSSVPSLVNYIVEISKGKVSDVRIDKP